MAKKKKGKQPAIMFYTGDYLKDPNLGMCSPATRGIWMDMLCLMHENGRTGELTGTPYALARTCRCSHEEMVDALKELSVTKAGHVTKTDGVVTVICRRMARECKERNGSRLRKQAQRGRDDVTEKSLPPLSSSVSSSKKKTRKKKPEPTSQQKVWFERFWPVYPRHADRTDAATKFYEVIVSEPLFNEVMIAAKNYERQMSSERRDQQHIKHAATWLNKDRWRDWIEPEQQKQAPWRGSEGG